MEKKLFLSFVFLFVSGQTFARLSGPGGEPIVISKNEQCKAVTAPLAALLEKNCKIIKSNGQEVKLKPTNAHWTPEACKEVWDLIKKIEHQAEPDKQAYDQAWLAEYKKIQEKNKEITKVHEYINSKYYKR